MRAKKLSILISAGVLLAVAAAAYFLFLGGPPSFARLRQGRDFKVIVITLDTTRADRLPSYGFRALATPTLDAFAARGVRFEKCYAQTPLTLPSHTTLFTGTLPLFHGIRDNGGSGEGGQRRADPDAERLGSQHLPPRFEIDLH